MKIIFFFQNVQSLIQILEMEQKVEKKLFVFYITAFELVAGNYQYYKEFTCYRQSMC